MNMKTSSARMNRGEEQTGRSMEIKVFDPVSNLQKTKAIWKRLGRGSSYFLSSGWVENWIKYLPPDAGVKFAAMTRNGEPVLAFFLGEKEIMRHYLFKSRCCYLNATGHFLPDCLCIEYNAMACNEPQGFKLREILDLIPGQWEELYLPGLDTGLFPGNGLIQSELSPYQLYIEREEPSSYVDLGKIRQKGGDYFSLLSSNTRAQVRRAYRETASRGNIATIVAADVERALEIYDEMVNLHQKTWNQRGEPGAFISPFIYDFHRDLINKRFHSGEIQLIRVSLSGRTLGCLYNFVSGGHVFYYQGGINYEVDPKMKPGIICHVEAIKYNSDRGNSKYDFMAGLSRYKQSLSTDEHTIVWAKIQKKRFKFMLENRLRSVKHRVKPALNRIINNLDT